MTIKELNEKIKSEAFTMRRGVENTNNPTSFYERMKNILLNNLPDIESALEFAAEAGDKISALETMLDDADQEITELRKQMTTQANNNTCKKGKPKA